ncbi:hypothetical protein GGS20DRAFT_540008 [Poronia punctata]|nr:hypothetical protein GGS20DRAFT_540008 [Poronia punctata]
MPSAVFDTDINSVITEKRLDSMMAFLASVEDQNNAILRRIRGRRFPVRPSLRDQDLYGAPRQSQSPPTKPLEWIDRVLETSYTLRNPVSPETVSPRRVWLEEKAVFVTAPKGDSPKPLDCYPCLHAALEDMRGRFSIWYEPFAYFHFRTRTLQLYPIGTPLPQVVELHSARWLIDMNATRYIWGDLTPTPDAADEEDDDAQPDGLPIWPCESDEE